MAPVCRQIEHDMKPEKYLSRLQLILGLIVSLFVFIVFPMVLEKDTGHEIKISTIRDLWEDAGKGHKMGLPAPTQYTLFFTDHKSFRIIAFLLFLIIGVAVETLCSNKIASGTYHSIFLATGVITGFFFLLACLLPFIPL